jgi:AcrR family transcriptional regulator
MVLSTVKMAFADQLAERSLGAARARSGEEIARIISATIHVMGRRGFEAATVTDVLAEAKLSTRAFYRHFRSKDELLLAVFEHDALATQERLRRRIATAGSTKSRFEAWLDEMLDLMFGERRGQRTRTLRAEVDRLSDDHQAIVARMLEDITAPLAEVLEEGLRDGSFPNARPEQDARTINAIVWNLTDASYAGGAIPDRASAREHVLRFCLPALGSKARSK